MRRLWDLIEARRWEEAGALLAEDVIIVWPHSGEVIRGRRNYLGVNRHYPEGWHIEVRSDMKQGSRACIEARVPHDALGVSFVCGFYELNGGKIQAGTEYWVDEKAEQPPAWRARWTERL